MYINVTFGVCIVVRSHMERKPRRVRPPSLEEEEDDDGDGKVPLDSVEDADADADVSTKLSKVSLCHGLEGEVEKHSSISW